jgi:hypothetical protein
MTLRTVLRSNPVRRAMAETPAPRRCRSRIMTISPSRVTRSPPSLRGKHRPQSVDRPPRGGATSAHLGNFQSALLGSFHPALTVASQDRSRIGLNPISHVCRTGTEPDFTTSLSATGKLLRGRQGQEPNPRAGRSTRSSGCAERCATRGPGRHRGTDDAAQPAAWTCRRGAGDRSLDGRRSPAGRAVRPRTPGRPGEGEDARPRHRSRLEARPWA